MKLKKLIKALDRTMTSLLDDFKVKGITCDSKEVRPDFVFVATKGFSQDGGKFIRQAIKKGARAIVSQRGPLRGMPKEVVWIKVKDTRKSLSRLAAEFYDHPSGRMKAIGITGTNGKTTVSYLIESLLKESSRQCAVIGTINYHFKNRIISAKNTTPGAVTIHSLLAKMVKVGIGYAVTEVSSHALDQARVSDVDFSYAIFTNLTHDHLDYHLSMQRYFQAKAQLFKSLDSGAVAIINADDRYAKKLIKLTRARISTYAIEAPADIKACDIVYNIEGSKFKLVFGNKKIDLVTKLIGRHNVYNILAAVSFGLREGIDLKKIKETIRKFSPPAGRLEAIAGPSGLRIFVDYAHTPGALKSAILAVREACTDRIIVTFGCGGERDRKKRPLMGRIACELADFVVITSDNPRSENPKAIIKDIVAGIREDNFTIAIDRKEAIFKSLAMAGEGSIVLICGKGHENKQILKNKVLDFNDRKIAVSFLK